MSILKNHFVQWIREWTSTKLVEYGSLQVSNSQVRVRLSISKMIKVWEYIVLKINIFNVQYHDIIEIVRVAQKVKYANIKVLAHSLEFAPFCCEMSWCWCQSCDESIVFDVSKSFSKQPGLYFVPIVMLTTLCELCFSKLSEETYIKIQVYFSLTSNVKGKKWNSIYKSSSFQTKFQCRK